MEYGTGGVFYLLQKRNSTEIKAKSVNKLQNYVVIRIHVVYSTPILRIRQPGLIYFSHYHYACRQCHTCVLSALSKAIFADTASNYSTYLSFGLKG
jgi:hypothetical protein